MILLPVFYSFSPIACMNEWMMWTRALSRETHFKFRTAVRKIFDELADEIREVEASGERPSDELQKKFGDYGLLAANIGPGKFLREFNIKLPGGIAPEEYDYFHEVL